MKITKRNAPPGKRKWAGRCRTCQSEAEAEESELTGIVNDQREGSVSWEKCPVCEAGPFGGMLFYPVR